MSDARDSYQELIAERFAEGGLGKALDVLELEVDEQEGAAAAAACVVRRIEEPGRFAALLERHAARGAELLQALLACGEIHTPESLKHGVSEALAADFAALMRLLYKLALVQSGTVVNHDVIIFHPWLEELLAADKPSAAAGGGPNAGLPPGAPEPPRLVPLVLCLNHLRGQAVRLTARGQIHQRHLDRAEAMFSLQDPSGAASRFTEALGMLIDAGCAAKDDDGRLEVLPGRVRGLLLEGPEPSARNALASFPDPELGLALLELLAREGGERGLPASRLMSHGELFLLSSAPHSFEDRSARILRKLRELIVFQLADSRRGTDGEAGGLRGVGGEALALTPLARRLLAALDGCEAPAIAFEAAAPEPAAIYQPDLDVLVPIDALPRAHWLAGAVARLERVDSMCRYSIDKAHAQAVFSREEIDFAEWIEDARRSAAHGLPENVERTLKTWLARPATAQVESGIVVRVSPSRGDAARAALLEAAKMLGARELAPGVFLARPEVGRRRIAAVLKQSGLRVRFDGDDADEAEGGGAAAGAAFEPAPVALADRYRECREINRRIQDEIDALLAPRRRDAAAAASASSAGPAAARLIDESNDLDRSPSRVIHEAVRSGRAIEIVLVRRGVEETWPLEPESVFKRGNRVYVSGYCPQTEDLRAFAVDEVVRARAFAADRAARAPERPGS